MPILLVVLHIIKHNFVNTNFLVVLHIIKHCFVNTNFLVVQHIMEHYFVNANSSSYTTYYKALFSEYQFY